MKLILTVLSALLLLNCISSQESSNSEFLSGSDASKCKKYLCLCTERTRLINFLAACPNTIANKCYEYAECRVQDTGRCGWTQDENLNRCLEAARPEILIDREIDREHEELHQPRCRPTGCSGTLCSDTQVMSTCEYKPEHGCYKYAVCKRQANGNCGWDFPARFNICMNEILMPLPVS
jgi:hypothetical protein